MKEQIKVPSVGESVMEATIGKWQKKSGDYVEQNETLVIMETDKASMDLVAEHSGQLNIFKQEGEEVKIGEVIAELDTSVKNTNKTVQAKQSQDKIRQKKTIDQPATNQQTASQQTMDQQNQAVSQQAQAPEPQTSEKVLSPAVRKWVMQKNLDPSQIKGSGPAGRLTKADVLSAQPPQQGYSEIPASGLAKENQQSRERMSTIRKRIAERMVESQHRSATLTTFNEIDMSQVMALRAKYKDSFQKKNQIKLGFMGIFIKATIKALQAFPRVNAFIEGDDEVVYNHACHIGIAVSTERGLVVPVIRNADQMTLADLEKSVAYQAEKAREGKIIPDDLTGGTFTLSNGGVFGSLMSTPILNPPQSGILGMHKIEQRPIAINGEVKIRPMMYVALSYDHRMVDGRESVGFLLMIKESVENPIRILIDV